MTDYHIFEHPYIRKKGASLVITLPINSEGVYIYISRPTDASMLNIQHYKLRHKGKWGNPGKGVALSTRNRRCSFCKESHWVALNYGRSTYFLYMFECLEKRLYENYTTMQCAVLNRSKKQHPTKQHVDLTSGGRQINTFINSAQTLHVV